MLTDAQALEVERLVHRKLAGLRLAPRIVDVQFMLGAPGAALQGGEHAFIRLGLGGLSSVLNWSLAGTITSNPASGSCTVDVLNGPTMTTLASICGIARPRLTAQFENPDQPPTGWSLDIPDASWLEARVTAVDGALEEVGLTLRIAVAAAPTVFVIDSTGAAVVDGSGNPVTWGA